MMGLAASIGIDQTAVIRQQLERYDYRDFGSLDEEVANVVTEMARIEQQVVGANRIGEKIDA